MADANTAEPAWPSAGRAWWTVAVLVLTAALCTMDRMVLILVVDPIRADLMISETQMSLLQGLSFALLYSVAGIPLGLLADRVSRRNLLLGGVAIWSLATLAGGLAASFGHLFLARVFVGAGEATLWPVAISMIADLLPPQRRGRAVSAVLMGQIFGSSAALILGGQVLRIGAAGGFDAVPLLAGRAPWRVLLMIWGALGAVAVTLLLTAVEPVRRGGGQAAKMSWRAMQPLFGHVRAHRAAILPLWGMAFCSGLAVYSSAAWTGAFFIRHFHVPPSDLGGMLGGLAMTCGLIGTIGGGFVSDRAAKLPRSDSRLNLIILAIIGTLPGAFMAFAPNVTVALALHGLQGICFPLYGVLTYIVVQNLFPGDLRGIATAVQSLFVGLLGASIGPVLVATLTQRVFADDTMVGYSLCLVQTPFLLMAIGCALLVRRAIRRQEAAV